MSVFSGNNPALGGSLGQNITSASNNPYAPYTPTPTVNTLYGTRFNITLEHVSCEGYILDMDGKRFLAPTLDDLIDKFRGALVAHELEKE